MKTKTNLSLDQLWTQASIDRRERSGRLTQRSAWSQLSILWAQYIDKDEKSVSGLSLPRCRWSNWKCQTFPACVDYNSSNLWRNEPRDQRNRCSGESATDGDALTLWIRQRCPWAKRFNEAFMESCLYCDLLMQSSAAWNPRCDRWAHGQTCYFQNEVILFLSLDSIHREALTQN